MIFLSDLRKENDTSTFLPGDRTSDKQQSEQFSEFQSEVLDGHLAKWYHILEVLVNFIMNRAPCSAIYTKANTDEGEQVKVSSLPTSLFLEGVLYPRVWTT